MKKTRKPKLIVNTLPKLRTSKQRRGPDDDDPITTSGTICTLVAQN
ncbi:hypothetical protein SAMN05216327_11225 [Dyadobacter sp. SG02]|nr:hypothetical protein [Dyadobacter sp. SG02]SEJ52722.1 hypothetical protein SAMN05216327_11225 [Dyadobacter sp. SG02]